MPRFLFGRSAVAGSDRPRPREEAVHMNERERMVASFLSASGWSDARRSALAGDASSRRYLRLTRLSGETSLLMEAPREMNKSVRSFLTIARHLSALGMSAPAILAED